METLIASPAAGRAILSADAWLAVASSLRLSTRERQIVQKVFDDRKESAIGKDLGISQHTVNTHLQRLYRKLNIGSRTQLVVRVMAEHLASADGPDSADLHASVEAPISLSGDDLTGEQATRRVAAK